jgi:RNA polymerase sigma-70 factor (ECF subfamily)
MQQPPQIALGLRLEAWRGERTAADVDDAERRALFARLARDHAAQAFGVARRLLGGDAEAEDLVQEAYLRAWRGLARFRRQADLKTWLFRILVNAGRDRLRRRRVREVPPPQQDRPVEDPLRVLSSGEAVERIWGEVERLPARQRECLLLRVRAGFGVAEIALLLGIGAGGVKSHLLAARKALLARLGSDLPGGDDA